MSNNTNLMQCARCKNIKYCCREHQVQDWASHKLVCKAATPSKEDQNYEQIILSMVSTFLKSLSQDLYPPEEIESFFGIRMSPSTEGPVEQMEVGSLVYPCWQFVFLSFMSVELRDILDTDVEKSVYIENRKLAEYKLALEISHAISHDILPGYFKQACDRFDDGNDVYLKELRKRGFSQISWNSNLSKLAYKKK